VGSKCGDGMGNRSVDKVRACGDRRMEGMTMKECRMRSGGMPGAMEPRKTMQKRKRSLKEKGKAR
jgi:hypothetical protein